MNDLLWQNPSALWGLWVLPGIVLAGWYRHRQVCRAALAFAGATMGPRLLPPLTWHRPALRTALTVLGVGLAILALARPAWDVYYVKTKGRGLDLLVALDVSRSMLADDAGDSRLGRAKTAIARLVDALDGDRVGLLLFAGQSVRVCPLTLDRGFFHASLRDAAPRAAGRGGTLLGPALDEARNMLDAEYDRDQVILLVTDGGDQESFPKTAAERLAKKGMRVLALGLGSSDPEAPLLLDGRPVRKKDGTAVTARLNQELLMEIAQATNGLYVPPERALELPEIYERYIGPLKKGENQEFEEKHYHERYQWFLAPALVALLAAFFLGTYPRRRTALTGLLLVLGLGSCSADRGAVEQAVKTWEGGDPAGAATALLEAAGDHPDDPVLAFDLGCAYQALGRRREAEAEYGRVFERGDARLRARAQTNLALLTVETLRRRVGETPESVAPDDRAELVALARVAIAGFQRARDLDPLVPDAATHQDRLARWLRTLEDAWARADWAAERERLAASRGSARILALLEFLADVRGDLEAGGALEDALLRAREIDPLLEGLPATFAEQEKPPAPSLLEALGLAVPGVRGSLAALVEAVEAADLAASARSIEALDTDLTILLPLVGDPGDAAARLARLHAAVAALTRDREDTEPPLSEPVRAAVGRQLESGRLGLHRLGLRWQPDAADPDWSPRLRERAQLLWQRASSAAERAGEAWSRPTGAPLSESSEGAEDAARALTHLSTEFALAAQSPDVLARNLDARQREHRARLGGPLEPLERRQRTVAGVLADQRELAAQLGYLRDALLRAMEDAPAPESEPDPRPARRDAAAATLDELAALLERAATGPAEPGIEPIAEPFLAAHRGLRSLWTSLDRLEPLLRGMQSEMARLLADSRGVAALEDGAEDRASELQRARRFAVAEQSLATVGIQGLRGALQRERAATVARSAAAGTPDPAPKETPEKDLLAAYDLIEPLLGRAEEGCLAALAAASPDPLPDSAAGTKALFAAVAAEQEKTLAALEEALERLMAATVPLAQLAERILAAEDGLVPVLRGLQRGESPTDAAGRPWTLETVRAVRNQMGELVALLPDALERELTKSASAPPASGAPAEPSSAEQVLRPLVAAVVDAQAECLSRLDSGDVGRTRDSVEAARDLARRLWLTGADLKSSLERGLREQDAVVQTTAASAATEKGRSDPERHGELDGDQGDVETIVAHLQGLVAAARSAAASSAQPGAAPGAEPAPGGLSPEVLELAEKNLPLAAAASGQAREALRSARLDAAEEDEREVHRLLKEILDRLQQDDSKDPSPESQPRAGQKSPEPSSSRSPGELERLARMVQERNRERRPEPEKRTPVEEDW